MPGRGGLNTSSPGSGLDLKLENGAGMAFFKGSAINGNRGGATPAHPSVVRYTYSA